MALRHRRRRGSRRPPQGLAPSSGLWSLAARRKRGRVEEDEEEGKGTVDLLQGLALSGLVIILGLGLAYAARRHRRSSTWLQTTGTIVSAQLHWVEGGLALEASYRYSVGGKTYTGAYQRHWRASLEAREELEEAMKRFADGAAAPVVYNPRRPEASGLDHGPASWAGIMEWCGWLLAGIGAAVLVTAVLAKTGQAASLLLVAAGAAQSALLAPILAIVIALGE